MKPSLPDKRTLGLLAVALPLLALFVYVVLRSGPLAPVPVTLTEVQDRAIRPALFGVGTLEARYRYPIGPTLAGRLLRVEAEVGDRVAAGQLLAEMDPVDLEAKLEAQQAALRRAESEVTAAQAQVEDGVARWDYARAQVARYEELLRARTASEDTTEAKRQEAEVARATLAVARARLESTRQQLNQAEAENEALLHQRATLRLRAPVAGLVVARNAEPGATVMAGRAVVELADPESLWIDTRFDQLSAAGLKAGLEARIALRSRPGAEIRGRVLRVEPLADSVTEELRAKIVFEQPLQPMPALGELAEATVALPEQPPGTALPNAALHRMDGRIGVWRVTEDRVRFTSVEIGASDLEGFVQITAGLAPGDSVVLHSHERLRAISRVRVVERLAP